MAVCVTYECHMQTYISGGLDAGLQYLRCVSDGDAAVLNPAIDIVSISVSISMTTLSIDMKISHMRIIEMPVCVTWVSYANLYILMALCENEVSPMHQQQGCRGLALGHRYRAWAMTWCLTGTRPVSISKMTLCIPMKLAICIAWKYQYVWHMSVICNIIYLFGLMWHCRISSALAVEMLQPFVKLLMCMWKYSLPPLV